jgi:hypothetical protein
VVKYHSGTKKLEGRILCTQPIKAPGGSQQIVNSHFETRTALAAQDAAGNADVTSLPVNVVGSCEVRPSDGYYNFVVHITPRSPDVLICDASGCSPSKTYSSNCPLIYTPNNCPPLLVTLYSGPVDVLKTAGAPLAQYAGGGRLWLNLYVYYSNAYPYGWYVAMNGTTLAYCPHEEHQYSSYDARTWTEYKEANASAIYQLYLQWPDGKKTKATISIYENKDGHPPYDFRVISSRTSQPPPPANIRILTRYGPVNTTIEPITMLDALGLNLKFLNYLNSDPQARTLFVETLRHPTTAEFNIPKINQTYTETVVNHVLMRLSAYDQSGRVLFVQVPYSFSLGAVLAITHLSVNITKPPANVATLSGGTAYVFGR